MKWTIFATVKIKSAAEFSNIPYECVFFLCKGASILSITYIVNMVVYIEERDSLLDIFAFIKNIYITFQCP